MQDATPQRVRPDGSIQLTDHDRTALGLIVAPAVDGDLPDSTLRFGLVLSPPGNEAHVVSPVTGKIARPPLVSPGDSVRAAPIVPDIIPTLETRARLAADVEHYRARPHRVTG